MRDVRVLAFLTIIVLFSVAAAVSYFVTINSPSEKFQNKDPEIAPAEEDQNWSYPFAPADEFGKSDDYSMVWIGESGFIWKRFLLVQAKRTHWGYAGLPYLLQAIPAVERRGYVVVWKQLLVNDQLSPMSQGLIKSLLLEVRPSDNVQPSP